MRVCLLYLLLLLGSPPLVSQDNGCTGPTFAQLFRDTSGRDVRLTSVIPYRGSPNDLLIGGMADGDVFLSRISRNGDVRWRRSFSTGSESTELTTLNTVLIDADGMIAGVGNDFRNQRQHGFLFRYDPLADRLLYLVQPNLDSELTGLVETIDRDYLLSGAVLDLPSPLFSRALTQRVARADGRPTAPATLLDLAGEENFLDLISHPDGGYIVVGNASVVNGAGSTRTLFLRLDEAGLPLNAQVGPVPGGENARLYGFDVEVVGNTTYLLQWGDIGKITGAENTSAILTAFDPAGLPRWTRRFKVDDFSGETAIELVVHADRLLLYGFSLNSARDIFLLEISTSGQLAWAKRYVLPGRAQVYQRASQQLLIDADAIYLTATYSFSGARPHEGLLLRLDAEGGSANECLEMADLTVITTELPAVWRPVSLTQERAEMGWSRMPSAPVVPALTTYDDCDRPCESCTTRSFSSAAFCVGDSLLVGDRYLTSPGVYTDTLTDTSCDSLVITEVLESAGPTATYRVRPECGLPIARVTIDVSGGVPPYSFAWSDTSIVGGSPQLPAGSYSVTVTDRAACTPFRLPVEVDVRTDGGTSLTALAPSCTDVADGAIVLSPPGSASLRLLQDSTFTPDRIDGLSAGTYPFILRTSSGCEVFREVLLPDPLPLTVAISGPSLVRLGDPATFTATPSGGLRYSWSPAELTDCANCPSAAFRLTRDTLITLLATDSNGCTATDSLFTRTDASLPRLYLPTAFSPNDDGTNDRWVPGFGAEVSNILDWQVFDRWGNLVWTYDANTPAFWDGGAAGEERSPTVVNPGLYVYHLTVRLVDGSTTALSGEVTVVR